MYTRQSKTKIYLQLPQSQKSVPPVKADFIIQFSLYSGTDFDIILQKVYANQI